MEGANAGGWATKSGLLCSDGVTIDPGAFKGQNGERVPLVYQHNHDSVDKVLGHAILEERPGGTYAWLFFNDTTAGKDAKALVEHGDVKSLSIWANSLKKRGQNVVHGLIRELSLVLAGANPGAMIDYVSIKHSDGWVEEDDEQAIITTGEDIELVHSDGGTNSVPSESEIEHADQTVEDVIKTLNPIQKAMFYTVVGDMFDKLGTVQHSEDAPDADAGDKPAEDADAGDKPAEDEDATPGDDENGDTAGDDSNTDAQEGSNTVDTKDKNDNLEHTNVWEDKDGAGKGPKGKYHLSHEDKEGIFADATKLSSMKDAVDKFAIAHGIESIDIMFPDAKSIDGGVPQFLKRRTEWVQDFMDSATKTPFARIKNMWADITETEARAKGYITGTLKKDEFFQIAKRITVPTTIYKKQKLDRDDIIDISDFDVVAWLKMEMRVMLDEEIARAALVGDGRDVSAADKINEQCVRPIAKENELFAVKVSVIDPDTSDASAKAFIKDVIRARRFYRGTGNPNMYISESRLTAMLLLEDTLGRDLYTSVEALASKLRVRTIVPVEVMEEYPEIVAIIVNPVDYTFGANKGGEINLFDQFDIDFNQEKYLIETRISGSLTKPKSALILMAQSADDDLIEPVAPSFNPDTGVVTIPTDANVAYFNAKTGAAMADGSTTTLAENASIIVTAVPATGFYFANSEVSAWKFRKNAV